MKQVTSGFSQALCVVALATASLTGCGLVDTPSEQTKAAETNVKNYYVRLETAGAKYFYATEAKAKYYPAKAELTMNMAGIDKDETFQGQPMYICNWSYDGGVNVPWYYVLTADKAIGLGLERSNDVYTDYWVELQAPLAKGNSWSFTTPEGELITATITMYGVSAKVEGKTYDDVVMVQYSGSGGTAGVQWFARGIGTIYSHIDRKDIGMIEERFQSMQ